MNSPLKILGAKYSTEVRKLSHQEVQTLFPEAENLHSPQVHSGQYQPSVIVEVKIGRKSLHKGPSKSPIRDPEKAQEEPISSSETGESSPPSPEVGKADLLDAYEHSITYVPSRGPKRRKRIIH